MPFKMCNKKSTKTIPLEAKTLLSLYYMPLYHIIPILSVYIPSAILGLFVLVFCMFSVRLNFILPVSCFQFHYFAALFDVSYLLGGRNFALPAHPFATILVSRAERGKRSERNHETKPTPNGGYAGTTLYVRKRRGPKRPWPDKHIRNVSIPKPV